MRWRDLLFAHWPIEVDALRPLVPSALDIDTFDGRAYVGIVPFGMEDVAPRGLPSLPRVGAFPEVNVRTYVRHDGIDGVWFFSLDAGSRVAVEAASGGFPPAVLQGDDGDGKAKRGDRLPIRTA